MPASEADDRSLCAECGCHYVYRCPCWERIGAPVVRAERPDPLGKPDPEFWRDSRARREWVREERKKQWRAKA